MITEPLVIVREALVLIHLVGFALLFGGWVSNAIGRTYTVKAVTRSGLGIMIASGLLLAIPFPDGVDLDYVKLAVKLVVALTIGAMFGVVIIGESAGRRTRAAFWAIGGLALFNAGIALFWN